MRPAALQWATNLPGSDHANRRLPAPGRRAHPRVRRHAHALGTAGSTRIADEDDPHRRRPGRVSRTDRLRSIRAQRRPPAPGRGVELHPRRRADRLSRPRPPARDGHQLPRLDARRDGLRADGAGLEARRAGDVPQERAAHLRHPRRLDLPRLRQPRPARAARGQRAGRPGRAGADRYPGPRPPADLRLRRQRPGAAPAAVEASARDDAARVAGHRLGRVLGARRRNDRQRPEGLGQLLRRGRAGATVRISAPFGAIALLWAEGRESIAGSDASLFGF